MRPLACFQLGSPFKRQVSGRWKADDEAERALARELVSLRACAAAASAAAAGGTSVWAEGQVRLAGSRLPSPS